ncbi:MAG TPA: hypothetical protein VHE34_08840 [Puia sp.]|uniref:hypothetical protein n=1 Tax=Puia sp. TaxID=2045100 RepID=UPI002CB76804|nr:hypothetical protein [Puia sp.]HVU95317.1 hypothetical protein [Puia sp.]
MSNKPLLNLLAAFCLVVSCKKNGTPAASGDPVPANKPRLYLLSYHSPSNSRVDTFQLAYDKEGRMTGAIAQNLKYTFSYPTTTSIEWNFVGAGQPSIHEKDFFTNEGIDSSFRIQDPSDSMVGKYEYSGGLLSKETLSWIYGGTPGIFLVVAYTYDANGNTIKTVQTDGQNSYQYVNEYTYTNKPGPLPIVFPANIPVPAKNLPATQVITNGTSSKRTITFDYVYDSAGRLIMETDTEDDGEVTVKTFTY